MEAKQIEEQIEGLTAKGRGLREKEAKASGIVQTIEKYGMEIAEYQGELEDLKETLAEHKSQKAEAVKATLISMQEKITALLPEGDGIVHINEKLIIGWLLPNKPLVPFEGLSGGQKIVFGQALGNSLLGDAKEKLLLYEAGEVDEKNLIALLGCIDKAKDETQTAVNTWAKPKAIPKGWNSIDLT